MTRNTSYMDRELNSLKRKINKLLIKCEEKGIELNDIEIGAIKQIGHAESMLDVNWLVHKTILRIFEDYKIR